MTESSYLRSSRGLIARIEAASEGSRPLDIEIARALEPEAPIWPFGYCTTDEEPIWQPRASGKCEVPRWTTSLDAALTLVPEGCGVELSRYWLASADDARWSAVLRWGLSGAYADALDKPTPALAIVAAALRARSTP